MGVIPDTGHGAGVGHPRLESTQSGHDRSSQVDAWRAPARHGSMAGEPFGHFGTDLETTCPYPRPNRGTDRSDPVYHHRTEQRGDHTRRRPPPPGVGNADAANTLDDHREAVRGGDDDRQPRLGRERSVGFAEGSRMGGMQHLGPMYLMEPRPPLWYPQASRHGEPCGVIRAGISVGSITKGGATEFGWADHPLRKSGISRSSNGLSSGSGSWRVGRCGRGVPISAEGAWN